MQNIIWTLRQKLNLRFWPLRLEPKEIKIISQASADSLFSFNPFFLVTEVFFKEVDSFMSILDDCFMKLQGAFTLIVEGLNNSEGKLVVVLLLLKVFSQSFQKYFSSTMTKLSPLMDSSIGFLLWIGKKVMMNLLRFRRKRVKLTIILMYNEFSGWSWFSMKSSFFFLSLIENILMQMFLMAQITAMSPQRGKKSQKPPYYTPRQHPQGNQPIPSQITEYSKQKQQQSTSPTNAEY